MARRRQMSSPQPWRDALLAFLGGFVMFASVGRALCAVAGVRADGIVVLTGGEHRLSEAAGCWRRAAASGC